MFNNNERQYHSELSQQQDSNQYTVEPAEVVDIIMDEYHPNYKTPEDIGLITFQRLSAATQKSTILNYARPYDPFIKTYPLLHEFVLIVSAPSSEASILRGITRYYYLNTTNIWSLINHNVLPYATAKIGGNTSLSKSNSYTNFTGNQSNSSVTKDFKFGNTFEENANVRPLQPYEGDVIYYGRFGQSIRFGSSVPNAKKKNPWSNGGTNGDPIIIISNNKPIAPVTKIRLEDINKDSSSIYLCDGQKIPIDVANKSQKSYSAGQKNNSISINKPAPFNTYNNKQIIITSDRLLFNAKNDSIFLIGKTSIGLSSMTINIDGESGVLVNTPKVYINSTTNTIFNSPKIYLGASANENVIMGPKFYSDVIRPLLQELINMKILTAFGPGSVSPNHIAVFQQLISKLDSTLSQRVYVEK